MRGKKRNEKWIKSQKLGTKTSINGVSFSQILSRQETHQKDWFFSLGISSNMYHMLIEVKMSSWRGQFSSNSRVPGVHPKDLLFWRGSGWMDSECFNYDARPCVFDTPRWWCHPQTTQTLTLRVWMKLRDTRGVHYLNICSTDLWMKPPPLDQVEMHFSCSISCRLFGDSFSGQMKNVSWSWIFWRQNDLPTFRVCHLHSGL